MFRSKDNYLSDDEFYTLIKFREVLLREPKASTFSLSHLSLALESDDVLHLIIDVWFGHFFDLPVKMYSNDSLQSEIDSVREEIRKYDQFFVSKDRSHEVLDKIEKVGRIMFGELGDIAHSWSDIYEYSEIELKNYTLSEDQVETLNTEIDTYIDLFQNDQLLTVRKNYFRFDLQKQLFIDLIQEGDMVAKYGSSFVIIEKCDKKINLINRGEFLLIQTIYTLQSMGYLNVNNVWISVEGKSDDFYLLHINVELQEQFLRELNEDYRGKNPATAMESFDVSTGLLKITNKDIFLIKGNKETDAARLVETLLKEDSDAWIERGEVYDDWGMTKDDRELAAKNKIYFAKKSANDAVEKATGITDFVEGSTKRFRINPKYRKKVEE